MEADKNRGELIRKRREELGLSVTDMSKKCGVAEKTWYRYESGEPIRADKVDRVLAALRWKMFPTSERSMFDSVMSIDESSWAYSPWIAECEGEFWAKAVAWAFIVVLDSIRMAVSDLSTMPAGSHVGQVLFENVDFMPERYLTRYDHEFMCRMCDAVKTMALQMKKGEPEWLAINQIICRMLQFELDFICDMIIEEGDEVPDGTCACVEGLFDLLFEDADVMMYFGSQSSDVPENTSDLVCAAMANSLGDGDNVFDFENWFKLPALPEVEESR